MSLKEDVKKRDTSSVTVHLQEAGALIGLWGFTDQVIQLENWKIYILLKESKSKILPERNIWLWLKGQDRANDC